MEKQHDDSRDLPRGSKPYFLQVCGQGLHTQEGDGVLYGD